MKPQNKRENQSKVNFIEKIKKQLIQKQSQEKSVKQNQKTTIYNYNMEDQASRDLCELSELTNITNLQNSRRMLKSKTPELPSTGNYLPKITQRWTKQKNDVNEIEKNVYQTQYYNTKQLSTKKRTPNMQNIDQTFDVSDNTNCTDQFPNLDQSSPKVEPWDNKLNDTMTIFYKNSLVTDQWRQRRRGVTINYQTNLN
eukprot:TRINITY_DN17991_c0_g1_i1.p1 TRINITY_DN17991_c0_g1~~TRINITY_DN17991_c0_g1_i1.p1  ORF type:complete len:198 (-),score=39.47 TRINITY_DN17991_c0_g1_i1:158-751(-)